MSCLPYTEGPCPRYNQDNNNNSINIVYQIYTYWHTYDLQVDLFGRVHQASVAWTFYTDIFSEQHQSESQNLWLFYLRYWFCNEICLR